MSLRRHPDSTICRWFENYIKGIVISCYHHFEAGADAMVRQRCPSHLVVLGNGRWWQGQCSAMHPRSQSGTPACVCTMLTSPPPPTFVSISQKAAGMWLSRGQVSAPPHCQLQGGSPRSNLKCQETRQLLLLNNGAQLEYCRLMIQTSVWWKPSSKWAVFRYKDREIFLVLFCF